MAWIWWSQNRSPEREGMQGERLAAVRHGERVFFFLNHPENEVLTLLKESNLINKYIQYPPNSSNALRSAVPIIAVAVY